MCKRENTKKKNGFKRERNLTPQEDESRGAEKNKKERTSTSKACFVHLQQDASLTYVDSPFTAHKQPVAANKRVLKTKYHLNFHRCLRDVATLASL